MNAEHRTSNVERRISSIEHRASRFGFSLTEVLLAVGILAVGMLFIAGVFPVSVHFTTVAAERTIAATVADEAFAKIKLCRINDANWIVGEQTPYEVASAVGLPEYEYGYPSNTTDWSQKYWWSAICRRIDVNDVQITVFVSRKVGTATTYRTPSGGTNSIRPRAIKVDYTAVSPTYELTLPLVPLVARTRINDGYTIVDDATGQIYRVLERYKSPVDNIIRLDKLWQGAPGGLLWVVPPPVSVGRYPCIAVYQKVMRF